MTFSCILPLPPSANASYRNVSGKGRAKTKAYRDWRKNAVLSIFAQVRADKRVAGWSVVHIQVPIKCALDVDNTIKPILDALVQSRRIDDDRHVWKVSAERGAVDLPLISVWGHTPMTIPATRDRLDEPSHNA